MTSQLLTSLSDVAVTLHLEALLGMGLMTIGCSLLALSCCSLQMGLLVDRALVDRLGIQQDCMWCCAQTLVCSL